MDKTVFAYPVLLVWFSEKRSLLSKEGGLSCVSQLI